MPGSMRTATTFNFAAFLGLTNLHSAIFNVCAFYAEPPGVLHHAPGLAPNTSRRLLHACAGDPATLRVRRLALGPRPMSLRVFADRQPPMRYPPAARSRKRTCLTLAFVRAD